MVNEKWLTGNCRHALFSQSIFHQISSNFIIFGTHIFKISKWSGVNFNQIRVRKKSLSGELQKTPPSEMETWEGLTCFGL